MKKTIIALTLIFALMLALTGCIPTESQAKSLVDENLKRHQTGGIQETEFETLVKSFEEGGLSDSGKEKMIEAFNTMIKKMTYSIQSCAVDPDNQNLYIVKVEMKTVDGNAIFIDQAPWQQIVDDLIEQYKSGKYDEENSQAEVLEKWVDHILEKSKTAETTKSTNVDIEVEIDKEKNTLYTEVKYNVLLGLSEDFEKLFEEKSNELNDMFMASFGLNDYVEMLNDIYKDIDNENLSISCAADEKTLIFTCKFKISNVTKKDAESLMDSESKDFEGIIDSVKEAGVPCNKVVVEYRGIDNKLLASKEESIK